MPPSTVDVLIVGLGPVGSALGLLLASSPRKPRVHVIERHASPYPLPRAVHLDGEALRILARIGCTSFGESETTTSYEWVNENGELLLRIPPDTEEGDLMFSQPFLERHLLELAGRHPNLSHEWGRELVALQDKGDHVVATTRKFIEGSDRMDGVQEVHAKFVVGCDGAQSTVRKLLGIEMEDLQFFFDWLSWFCFTRLDSFANHADLARSLASLTVTDVLLDEPRVWEPMNLQICTPTRPTTVVSGGSPQRRRWEFMGLPGESAADLNKESKAWELLKPFDVHSGNAKLEKSAVYRFQAKWGKEWGKGRCWLAGDAAHLMPVRFRPFYTYFQANVPVLFSPLQAKASAPASATP